MNTWFSDLFRFLFRPSLQGDPPVPTQEESPPREEWKPFEGPLERIPVGRTEMIKVYGDPDVSYKEDGSVVVSKKWANQHGVTVSAALIPGYEHRMWMHKLVAPYFREAMRRSVEVAPWYKFEKIGCFAPRHQRHDKTRPLSDHTWGIAFDINPSKNKAFYRKEGDPKPFEAEWIRYSNIPSSVVEAWESVGFEWGGRWETFCDPMHMSLRK